MPGKDESNIDKMNTIATNIVANKAIEDRKKELMKQKSKPQETNQQIEKQEDNDDNLSDFSADSEEREIMRQMKEKINSRTMKPSKKNQHMALKGSYEKKTEKDFFKYIENKKEKIVVHFAHEKFERCLIVDKHLAQLAYDHQETLFIRLDAEHCSFLVAKLKVQILPAIYCFINGEVKDMVIGFEDFGNRDDFKTAELAQRLGRCGVLKLNADEKFKLKKKGKRVIHGESDSDEDY